MTIKKKKLSEQYVQAKMMRNWITLMLPKLSYEQIELLYGMVKRWSREEESS